MDGPNEALSRRSRTGSWSQDLDRCGNLHLTYDAFNAAHTTSAVSRQLAAMAPPRRHHGEQVRLLPLLVLLLVSAVAADAVVPPHARYTPTWSSVTSHPDPSWFGPAKFGIYAHFGPYSVPAFSSEWYSRNMYVNGSDVWKHHVATYGEAFGYKDFVPQFTIPRFDAAEWAALYRRAGAQYAGPVAEHADGFAMFNTSASSWNAVQRGPMRDVVGEIAAAVRDEGLHLLTSMHHMWLWAWYPTFNNVTDCADPRYELTAQPGHGGLYGPRVAGPGQFSHPTTTQEFQDYFTAKLTDLITRYDPDLVYFDSKLAATIDTPHRLRFLSNYYNQALDRGNQQVAVTYKNTDLEPGAGILDYERGGVTGVQATVWQTDDSMDRNSWSWVDPPALKNATELVGELLDIVSKNGNFLLNCPPHADGSWDPAVVSVLHDIGDWLAVHGAAVYATVPRSAGCCEGPTQIVPGFGHEWPIFTSTDFRFTASHNAVFVAAFAWPNATNAYVVHSVNASSAWRESGPGARLVAAAGNITDVTLMGPDAPTVSWALKADGLHLSTSATPAVAPAYVFRLHLNGATAAEIDAPTRRMRERIHAGEPAATASSAGASVAAGAGAGAARAATPTAAAAVTGCPASPVALMSQVELRMPIPGNFTGNPYNTSELRLRGHVTLPDAPVPARAPASPTAIDVLGFRHQNFTRALDASGQEVDTPLGVPDLALRFAPRSVGSHSVALYLRVGPSGSETPVGVCTFTVTAEGGTAAASAAAAANVAVSSAAGVVRVGPNKQHFAVVDGRDAVVADWFPVGENLAWTDKGAVFSFESYLTNISAAGGNYVRLWLTDPWDHLYIEDSLGNYSLVNAWHVDEVLRIAEARGVRALMCTESFNLFCNRTGAPCDWDDSVYNSARGGPLQSPDEFFTDTRARALYRQRLQYLVSRYSSSSAVFAWEFFNEVDIAAGFTPLQQQAWVGEMAPALRAMDAYYAHPISTSFCCHDVPEVYSLPSVDFSMTHSYSSHNARDMADNAQYWTTRMASEYGKPTYVAETGEKPAQHSRLWDPLGRGLHNALWAPVVSMGAASAMTWWWDDWVAPGDLYRQFTGVRAFVDSVQWNARVWSPLLDATPPACTDVPPSAAYTCAQQASWGKCNASWMDTNCCRTCHACAESCVGPPMQQGLEVAPGVRLYASVGAPLPHATHASPRGSGSVNGGGGGGDSGGAAMATHNDTVVAWLHNLNSTFWLQNASVPAAERPPTSVAAFTFTLPVRGFVSGDPADGASSAQYVVQWVDTTTGKPAAVQAPQPCAVAAADAAGSGVVGTSRWSAMPTCLLTLTPPAFDGDVGFNVRQQAS